MIRKFKKIKSEIRKNDLPLSHMLESTHLHSPCHSTLGPLSRSLGQDCKVTGNTVPSASQVGMATETASLSEACSVVSFDVANATADQSLLKSQRVFEVKSPEVQILAYSTTCPSNINSLHQEHTYQSLSSLLPVPVIFSWDECNALHPGCCCSCRRR